MQLQVQTPKRAQGLQKEFHCDSTGCKACRGHFAASKPISLAVHEVLKSPAQLLDIATRTSMERRFAHDFSKVRVHANFRAAESARSVNALAYTVGNDIVLGAGQEIHTVAGRQLLAHELAHVVQQTAARHSETAEIQLDSSPSAEREADSAGRRAAAGLIVPSVRSLSGLALQKAETLGTRAAPPIGAMKPYKRVTGSFDGKEFVLRGDGKVILTASGQSGRPNTVRAADAKACGGAPSDSYMNNARYVGIADNGPIPEGEFTFRRSDMVTFTTAEQAKMALAGETEYVDPAGLALHGDWGAARAALHPVRLVPATFCGSTSRRSGFYLHGGIMPGSSGCIDIGNSAIMQVVNLLTGYVDPVHVTVKYAVPAPVVGEVDRLLGRFMYPSAKNPGIVDRLKSLFDAGDDH